MTASLRLALIAAATSAATLSLATPANAADDEVQFLSPSANIRCEIAKDQDDGAFAVCKIREHTWAAAQSDECKQASVPGANGGSGSDLQVGLDGPPCVGPHTIQIFDSGPYAPAPLDFGQTRTLGSITCASEPSGVTCRDGSSGHFFTISRNSYQLG
jgi:hypothetical protein